MPVLPDSGGGNWLKPVLMANRDCSRGNFTFMEWEHGDHPARAINILIFREATISPSSAPRRNENNGTALIEGSRTILGGTRKKKE
ncbi:hypothetical protein KM043_010876 [Ampulex compressa]|nr:hypothetical protein KM043_010876 [Ampulex compressa]